jgi:predicted RNase H-like HicB family nuclease
MADEPQRYTVRVHQVPGQDLWAEVLELPGCFAAGATTAELNESLTEAISLYLDEPVRLDDEPGEVTERHVLAHTG